MATPTKREIDRFLEAAFTGNLRLLKQLAKNFDKGKLGLSDTFASIKDENYRTVLHAAAVGGNSEICNYLVSQLKLDVNMQDRNGYTALHHAALGERVATVQSLVELGADTSLTDLTGCTPLHFTAERGDAETLEVLISKGANIECMAESGTALHKAAAHAQEDAVKVLLSHNANPNLAVHHFFTPLLLSIAAESFDCLELLLKGGADPNMGACGVLPLGHAASMGKAKMVKCLLKYGADPNAGGFSGMTSLERAALRKDGNIMGILFPLTARIASYPDWSIRGIQDYINSPCIREQRVKEDILQWKEEGKQAFQRKDYLNAIFWYTKTITMNPNDETLFSNRSLCWARLNEGDKALSDAVDCVNLKPDWSKAHYRGGAALKLLKNYITAAEAFAKALDLDPNNKEIEKELMEMLEMSSKD